MIFILFILFLTKRLKTNKQTKKQTKKRMVISFLELIEKDRQRMCAFLMVSQRLSKPGISKMRNINKTIAEYDSKKTLKDVPSGTNIDHLPEPLRTQALKLPERNIYETYGLSYSDDEDEFYSDNE